MWVSLENMLNYVICGKLQLWREALDFEFGNVLFIKVL